MKRIPLTPELEAEIRTSVGPDVDTTGFAVFEAIAINDLPLPGKRGLIFEKAVVAPLTLAQMVADITTGNHQPLLFNHNMSGVPMGRAFRAELHPGSSGETELRILFYVDPTNEEIAAKIDAGSLDEVSVQFLAEKILCSDCGFDYRGPDADWMNFLERTCDNGHEVGLNGTHVRLVGLETFTELSLVSRGAANKPKIVGKSASKLAAPTRALAARGFEIDELVLSASLGEDQVDLTAVLTKLEEKTAAEAIARTALAAMTTARDEAVASLATANEQIQTLTAAAEANTTQAELEAAKAATDEARTVLTDIYTRLATATDSDKSAPESIAELKAGIEEMQSKLSAAIPVGGAAANTQSNEPEVGAKFAANKASAFKTR